MQNSQLSKLHSCRSQGLAIGSLLSQESIELGGCQDINSITLLRRTSRVLETRLMLCAKHWGEL